MTTQHKPESQDLGFFKPSGFHLGATLFVIALSIFAFLPSSFTTLVNGTVLVNFVLVAIMVVSLIILIIDLMVGKDDNGGVTDA